MKRAVCILIAMALIAPLFANGGADRGAAKFPTKQIRMVVQAAPGGSSDLNCRTIAPGMESVLGVPVVVENRPGGGGAVALSWGAEQPPDGYVINHLPVDIALLKPTGSADVTPDQFDFLCRTAYHGAGIAVPKNSKYRDFNDFMAAVKARPGEITVGNSGIGAIWHLAAAQLEAAAGVKFSHIPFEGAAPSITALLGGHLDAIICSPAETAPQVQGGDLRLLAVFYDERMDLFPDAPTLKEFGIDLTCLAYVGFGVPKGTPRDVIDTLVNALKASYDSDTYQNMLKTRGLTPGWMGPEEYARFAKEDYDKYVKLVPQVLNK